MRPIVLVAIAATSFAACGDPRQPPSAPTEPSLTGRPTIQGLFSRFVALGTSNSMGVQSAGIFAGGQRAAWPAQLAARAGAAFSLPLVQDPGCGPPLLSPLAADLALVGTLGEDVLTGLTSTCSPLGAGITLPTNSVAISGANVHDALFTTPEMQSAISVRMGALYSRVLTPGQTQVRAMLAQRPTLVSIELAANEVLPASAGRISAMTPYADWERDFDQVVAAVKSIGARAVIVGVPNDAASFPSIRRAGELHDESAPLLGLGVVVHRGCSTSPNHIFIPGYLVTRVAAGSQTATCADVPGAADYVLTPGDISAINARMAQMNAHMQAVATQAGWAYFSLSAVYDLPKSRFSIDELLFSPAPFGANMSLDGVHPSTQGQAILAAAAAKAINAAYGVAIP